MKITLMAIMIFVCTCSFFIEIGNSAEVPDYSIPVSGWTSEELEEYTLQCVSDRLTSVKTEYATLMLEKLCYYNVISEGKKGK